MSRNSFSVKDAIRSGGKLTRKALEGYQQQGASDSELSKLISKHGNVGSKARNFMDAGEDSGPKKPWKHYSTAIPGQSGERLWLNKKGGVANNDQVKPEWAGEYGMQGHQAWKNRTATTRSAEKLNNYLDRTGYSLKPGKGMAVVDHRPLWIKEKERFRTGPGINTEVAEGFREYVPIYGQVQAAKGGKRKKPEEPSAEHGGGEGGGAPEAFGGSEEANRLIREGTFDVPPRPTYGESFLKDYMNAGEDEGPDGNAPIMQPSSPSRPLRDGYPSESDWTPPRTDGSENWNITPGGTPEDNEELSRTFAASQAFRDRLFQMVGS